MQRTGELSNWQLLSGQQQQRCVTGPCARGPTCGLLLSGRCGDATLDSCKLWPGATRLVCCAARGRAEAVGGSSGGRSAAARGGGAAAAAIAAEPSASRFIRAGCGWLVQRLWAHGAG